MQDENSIEYRKDDTVVCRAMGIHDLRSNHAILRSALGRTRSKSRVHDMMCLLWARPGLVSEIFERAMHI